MMLNDADDGGNHDDIAHAKLARKQVQEAGADVLV